jgi:hypothetical protein
MEKDNFAVRSVDHELFSSFSSLYNLIYNSINAEKTTKEERQVIFAASEMLLILTNRWLSDKKITKSDKILIRAKMRPFALKYYDIIRFSMSPEQKKKSRFSMEKIPPSKLSDKERATWLVSVGLANNLEEVYREPTAQELAEMERARELANQEEYQPKKRFSMKEIPSSTILE